MTEHSHRQTRSTHKTLLDQIQSEYFDEASTQFLQEFPLEDGILLFYTAKNPFFSLGVGLLSHKETREVIWKKEEPLWRTCEKIEPINITKRDDEVTLHFEVCAQSFSRTFSHDEIFDQQSQSTPEFFKRTLINPILKPDPAHPWESSHVFNPAVLYLDNKVHFIYRAIGASGISVFGYAASQDGIHIDERLSEPVFVSPHPLKRNGDNPSCYVSGGSWCGCEDPRMVQIDDTIYMTYTAFDGSNPPCVTLTSIQVNDFLAHRWNWTDPILLSPPGEKHKNWVIFPEKLNGQYAVLHSITPNILIDYFDSLSFDKPPAIKSSYYSSGRDMFWDNWVRGVGPPPIKTKEGWLVLYHAMDHQDPDRYKIGAMILDECNPEKILSRSASPLLAPDQPYENEGFKTGVIYCCGAIVKNNKLYIYYGGADSVICCAQANLDKILNVVKSATPISIKPKKSSWIHSEQRD